MYTEPVKLTPAFKDYLWGGTKLKTEYNKASDLDIVAESWELSTHKDGQSIVATGQYAGLTLSDMIEQCGHGILGSNAQKFDYFPILIKFIDAKDNLSVQVHPDDTYSLAHNGEYGKTEMWYILECEEGASLYYGFNQTLTKEEFRRHIEDNTLLSVLNKVPVKKGDVFFIPAGTVHAIGKGIVICEIQQNSNTTYRVYDYGRRDAQGNTRPLHIEQAITVSALSPAPEIHKAGGDILASCQYFTVRKISLNGEKNINIDTGCFHSIIVTDGGCILSMHGKALALQKGDSVFIPAQDNSYTLEGMAEIILSYV